jgi:hypothetical protein
MTTSPSALRAETGIDLQRITAVVLRLFVAGREDVGPATHVSVSSAVLDLPSTRSMPNFADIDERFAPSQPP